MMVVDDTYKNQGEKRITILDPNLKNISINCGSYGKFLAYFTFSKWNNLKDVMYIWENI